MQPPLELAPLTPTALARMLHDSGIKWRVIVVSACYSGGFIEPLRDDNSIVITAAAPDRTSFGCEAGPRLHLFRRGVLPRRAGEDALLHRCLRDRRRSSREREAAEGLRPSLPQMWVGAHRELRERLKNAARCQTRSESSTVLANGT